MKGRVIGAAVIFGLFGLPAILVLGPFGLIVVVILVVVGALFGLIAHGAYEGIKEDFGHKGS